MTEAIFTLGVCMAIVGGCAMDSANMLYPIAIIAVGAAMMWAAKCRME